MIFSDLYKSSKSKRRQSQSQPQPQPSLAVPLTTGYDADLLSKDKAKQKEAVKRYLAEKVRTDWELVWPPKPSASAVAPAPSPAEGPANSPPDAADNNQDQATKPEGEPAGNGRPLTLPRDTKSDGPIDSGAEADSDGASEVASVYSVVSDDPQRYRARAEWTSEISDDDGPTISPSPFRFDTPDSIGVAVQASIQARKARRRRADRDEMTWNEGLACFTARRDAWTGGRAVRLKPRPPMSPTSPTSPRRSLWRFRSRDSQTQHEAVGTPALPSPTPHMPSQAGQAVQSPGSPAVTSPLSPITSQTSQHSQHSRYSQHSAGGVETITPPASDGDSQRSSTQTAANGSALPVPAGPASPGATPEAACTSPPATSYPVETVVPVPRPLLPAGNPMRASITPALYLSIYDKVVAHSLQPSCPINLADMTRSCVAGWKRDGEWPPRPAAPALDFAVPPGPAAVVVVRSRRRKEKEQERERERRRRDSAATAGSSGVASRRLSLAGLIGLGGGGEEKEKEKEGDKDKADAGDDGSGGKGIRRSLQRVLGLAHGHGHGHGHSVSVGSVGSVAGNPAAQA